MTTPRLPLSFSSPDELSDSASLERVLGPVDTISRAPLATSGFSGAYFERLHVQLGDGTSRSLILKRVPLGSDWPSRRLGDEVGRTAVLLAATEFDEVWDIFHSPYLAYASDGRGMALLMEDLGEHLFPDERTPLPPAAEDALLRVLARLHARFWESPALGASWLTPMAARLDVLAPGERDTDTVAPPPPAIRDGLTRGWSAALRRLPPAVREGMTAPGDRLAPLWRALPRTLLHGDAKVANFALLPDGRVSAFDWGAVGPGPVGVELGWYLSMNATRLARSKEGVLDRYRELLERELGRRIPAREWEGMVVLAIWSGARVMLWSKALALESGRAGAEEEWAWWVDGLSRNPLP